MSRFQPVKRFYNPLKGALCSPFRHHPCSPFSSYPVKARQVPSGTYDVIARTLADYPGNINRMNEKKWQEARDQGRWIDIHDYDPAVPYEYDVMIRDIDGEKLRTEISEAFSIPYLSKAAKVDATKVVKYIDGHLYGDKRHPIIPCVVHTRNGDEARWVFFILDTVAPTTYLSPQVLDVLNLRNDIPAPVYIAGYRHTVYPSPPNSHFFEVNILGADFCNANQVSIGFLGDYKIKCIFGGLLE